MKHIRRSTMAAVLILLLFAVLMLLNARLSFCWTDEAFYSTLAHRLYLGDSLIADEWHPIQFYAPLLLPFYAAYKAFVPSSDGVILFFRVLAIFSSVAVSLALFAAAHKRYGLRTAFPAALLALLYTRGNILGPSYYVLSVHFLLGACLLGLRATGCAGTGQHRIFGLLCGAALSAAVLCNPYLALFILPAAGIALLLRRRLPGAVPSVLGYAAFGVCLCAAAYIAFLLSRSSMSELLANLPSLFHDPRHAETIQDKLSVTLDHIRKVMPLRIIPFVLLAACGVIFMHLRGREIPRAVFILYLAAAGALMLIPVADARRSFAFVVTVPFSVYMLPLLVHHVLRRGFSLPQLLYLCGAALSAAFFLASNTGLAAMTTGFCLCALGAMLTLSDLCFSRRAGRMQAAVVLIILALILVPSVLHRLVGVYRDAPLDWLDTPITRGPGKGLMTTKGQAQQYETVYDTIVALQAQDPHARVLYSKRGPWCYLVGEWTFGTPTGWTMYLSNPWLLEYYAMHPDALPDYVFVFEPDVAAYYKAPFNSQGGSWTPNANEFTGAFWAHILENSEIAAQNDCVTVYKLSDAPFAP